MRSSQVYRPIVKILARCKVSTLVSRALNFLLLLLFGR
jgi:hypothetical protein